MSFTLEDVLAWGPCYQEDRVRELWGCRDRVTVAEVLRFGVIPADDRLWLVLREGLIPEDLLHRFACRVASDVLDAVEARGLPVDPRSREAIAIKLRWLDGDATDVELTVAWDAALDVVWAFAEGTTWDADRDAAMAAAWSSVEAAARAAWSAARFSTRAATRDATRVTRDAVMDAAWDSHSRILLEMISRERAGDG
jgi:hypothetical protein